jgi:hypothetical protein
MTAMRAYREYTLHRSAEETPYALFYKPTRASLLAKGFNMALAHALQLRDAGYVRYFAMLHADIVPEPGFLDKLFKLMQLTEADVISTVIPIKNAPQDGHYVEKDGVKHRIMLHDNEATSTAIDEPDGKWQPARRLTLTELAALPVSTFDAADLNCPGRALLVNTGLWIGDLFGEWANRTVTVNGVEELECAFSIDDRIVVDRSGETPQYKTDVEPEDWRFSRYLHRIGAKVLATTDIHANHIGTVGFSNTLPTRQLQETSK